MTTFRDSLGYLHHKPVKNGNPLTSENGPCYDGDHMVVKYINDEITLGDCHYYMDRTMQLYGSLMVKSNGIMYSSPKVGWRVTPVSDRFDFSRDNWNGVYVGIEVCELMAKKKNDDDLYIKVQGFRKTIPIFHKQRKMFIRDLPLVLGVKYKWMRKIGIFLPQQIANVITMKQTHKKGGTVAKTDGKIMGFCMCHAFGWKRTFKKMDSMLSDKRDFLLPTNNWHLVSKHIDEDRKFIVVTEGVAANCWSWDSWYNIWYDYFYHKAHPSPKLIRKWEESPYGKMVR